LVKCPLPMESFPIEDFVIYHVLFFVLLVIRGKLMVQA